MNINQQSWLLMFRSFYQFRFCFLTQHHSLHKFTIGKKRKEESQFQCFSSLPLDVSQGVSPFWCGSFHLWGCLAASSISHLFGSRYEAIHYSTKLVVYLLPTLKQLRNEQAFITRMKMHCQHSTLPLWRSLLLAKCQIWTITWLSRHTSLTLPGPKVASGIWGRVRCSKRRRWRHRDKHEVAVVALCWWI